MIINLFSVFDPCTGFISINWLRSIMILILFNYNYWLLNNNIQNLIQILLLKIHTELKLIIPLKGSSLLFTRIILTILINNLIGLLPYVFTSSAHLSFSLRLALPTWLSLIIFGWIFNYNKILAHIVPMGTPNLLMPFIVIIESIRNLIRPGSLAVRLSANIIAGHLMITLLGNNVNFTILIIIILLFIILIIFELAVRLIQSYVFITLLRLYSREI